jgi:hypothetical protein
MPTCSIGHVFDGKEPGSARAWRASSHPTHQDGSGFRAATPCSFILKPTLKELIEESCRLIGYADDLVCCLAIELEIELRFRPTVCPIAEARQLAPNAGKKDIGTLGVTGIPGEQAAC